MTSVEQLHPLCWDAKDVPRQLWCTATIFAMLFSQGPWTWTCFLIPLLAHSTFNAIQSCQWRPRCSLIGVMLFWIALESQDFTNNILKNRKYLCHGSIKLQHQNVKFYWHLWDDIVFRIKHFQICRCQIVTWFALAFKGNSPSGTLLWDVITSTLCSLYGVPYGK